MENYHQEDLELHYRERDNKVTMEWRGLSTLHNPNRTLDPYLEKAAASLKGKEVDIDFRNIQFINSSSFVSICNFISLLDEMQIPTTVLYDETRDWQRFSFSVLEEFADDLERVKFSG